LYEATEVSPRGDGVGERADGAPLADATTEALAGRSRVENSMLCGCANPGVRRGCNGHLRAWRDYTDRGEQRRPDFTAKLKIAIVRPTKSRRHNVAVAELARLGSRDLIQPRQFIKRRLVASCSVKAL
jgi:hypothetical protein